jgi:hypothetical protein
MDLQIKNCPFCDSEAKLKTIFDDSDYCFDRKTGKQIEYYDVHCTNNSCYLSDGAGWQYSNPVEIVEFWNKRNKSIERQNKLKDLGI